MKISPWIGLCVLVAGGSQAAAPDQAMPRTLTVVGLGTAKGAPDEANFSSGVVTQGESASQAFAANSQAMSAVMATLKRHGIPERNIQTSDLSLSPQYQTCRPGEACPQRIVGYQVSNNVNVTVSLDKTGEVLDALASSGSNQIGGISFSIHDPKPLLAQARADAVKDAMSRAQLFARAANVTLGPILSIQEGGAEAPPRPLFKAMVMEARAVPIAGGEQSLSATVSITWIIK